MRCVLCWQVLQLSGAGIKPDDIKLVVRSAESGGVRATAYLEAEIPTANQISETLKATTKEKASAELGSDVLDIGDITVDENPAKLKGIVTVTDREACTFNLLLASELCKEGSPRLCTTRYQDIPTKLFVKMNLTMAGVLEGSYARKYLVVSHRWCEPGQPDPEGIQELAIKQALRENPEIKYVWHDVSRAHMLFSHPRDVSRSCGVLCAVLVHAIEGALRRRSVR